MQVSNQRNYGFFSLDLSNIKKNVFNSDLVTSCKKFFGHTCSSVNKGYNLGSIDEFLISEPFQFFSVTENFSFVLWN